MNWIEQAVARSKSGEKWDVMLADQSVEQIKLWITQADEMPPDVAVSFLTHLSRHADSKVRKLVGETVGQWSYTEAIQVLMPLLADEQPEVRVAATISLGRMRTYNVVPLLERMAYDESRLVRMAASQALLQLTEVSPADALHVGIHLIQDDDPIVASSALYAVYKLRSTAVRDYASGVVGGVKRYHPTLHEATNAVCREAVAAGYGSPDSFLKSESIQSERFYVSLGEETWPQFHSVIRDVDTRIRSKRRRQLYGRWSVMREQGRWILGEPPFISCLDGYKYQFSIALSPDAIPNSARLKALSGTVNFGDLFSSPDADEVVLAVALLADDEFLSVGKESQVRQLRLPQEGASNIVDFTVRGIDEGESSLQVLIYYQGSLLLRAKTLPIKVKAQPGEVKDRSGAVSEMLQLPVTATLLDQDEDLTATASQIKQGRRGSLLIDKNEEKFNFVLFYEDGDDYKFECARVPAEGVIVDFNFLRKKLRELVELRAGWLKHRAVFLRDSFDMKIAPEEAQQALEIIREAGRELWLNLFSDPGAEPIRKQLLALLSTQDQRNILQIVSDDLFVPWQLMYIDDGEETAKANLVWGLRFQIEQMLGVGIGLKSFGTGQPNTPIVAYINKYLPQLTLKEHSTLFPAVKYTEGDVLNDFKSPSSNQAAFYFYCHAKYDGMDKLGSWIKLTDDQSRLTLRALHSTSLDPKTQKQLEFLASPLIFLNACESGQVESSFYQSLVGFLLTKKKAGGVIGTETEMPAFFATNFAKEFWQMVGTKSSPVGQVLFDLRKRYWEEFKNPLGLLYSLYANSELQISV